MAAQTPANQCEEFTSLTLCHALFTPPLHPLESATLVKSRVRLTVRRETLRRRVHYHYNVQIPLHTRREIRDESSTEAILGREIPEGTQEGFQLLGGVQTRDFPRAQQTVDEFQEGGVHLVIF